MVGRGAEPQRREAVSREAERSPATADGAHIPDHLGPYQVEALVVSSAFSRVYRARDEGLGRQVAIKVFHLSPEKAARLPYDTQEWCRRFLAEGRVLARLDHPHVVRVDGLGRLADGTPFLVMPWHPANLRREIGRDFHDESLPAAERPRAVTPERARQVLRQTCLGLAALHAKGIVHRDLKPTNLLLTARENGMVRLCDLGMARLPDGGLAERPGVWIGTADYCAPEQRADASSATDRADIHALGVLAYRLVTGRLPKDEGAPALPSALVPGLPPVFDRLVSTALSPRPEDRPTAVAVAAWLAAETP